MDYPYWDYDEEDSTLYEPKNMCKYRIRKNMECGGLVSGSSGYCLIHLKTKCITCQSQATHNCEEDGCKTPLCDNRYCTTDHNIKKHIYQWKIKH